MPPLFVGWDTGRKPTPSGGTFAGQHKLSMGSGTSPRPKNLPSLSILSPYLLTIPSMTPGHRWATKVAGFGDHLHSHTAEVFLCSLYILQGYNQDTLGRLQGKFPQRFPDQQVPHMIIQGLKLLSCACVVFIPRLREIGMRGAEIINEREDPNTIRGHVQGIPLGHAFLAVKEVVRTIHITHHCV